MTTGKILTGQFLIHLPHLIHSVGGSTLLGITVIPHKFLVITNSSDGRLFPDKGPPAMNK